MYTLHETNPNVPSGGCLCSGAVKGADTRGPFLEFGATTPDPIATPFSVLCSGCPAGRGAIEAARPNEPDTGIAI